LIPIKFKEQNITFSKPASMTDEECGSLPAYRGEGQIISCWKMGWKERIKALFTGVVWFGVLASGQPPIWLAIDRPFIKQKEEVE
jgi:hypothetical protein